MAGMGFSLEWHGDKIGGKFKVASRKAIDVVTALCVVPAKAATPVITGTAQGSIMARPAEIIGKRVRGFWGSFDVNYFIWLEIGARGRSGIHMLRRAADRFYPTLAGHIRGFIK